MTRDRAPSRTHAAGPVASQLSYPQHALALVRDIGLLAAASAAGALIAELAGAENLGTAFAFGQIAFALALVFILLRR